MVRGGMGWGKRMIDYAIEYKVRNNMSVHLP
jgi:hypothetical protein